MSFSVTQLNQQQKLAGNVRMANYNTGEKRLYWNESKTKLLPEGHEEAKMLYLGQNQNVGDDIVAKYTTQEFNLREYLVSELPEPEFKTIADDISQPPLETVVVSTKEKKEKAQKVETTDEPKV